MPSTQNPHKGRTGLNRVVHAAGYSWDGLRSAYAHESAFRQECWLAFVLVPVAFWLGSTWIEVALLAGSAVLVLVAELLNSAVEATVDRVSMDLHALAKQAKDYGSAAVLLSLLLCSAIWVAALWQRFAQLP
jgi:diacylglycerol kinase (ATP)